MADRLEIGKPCVHIRCDKNQDFYATLQGRGDPVPVEREIYIPRDFVQCPGCSARWLVVEEIVQNKLPMICSVTGQTWDGEPGYFIEDFRPCRDTSKTVEALKSLPLQVNARIPEKV